MFLNVEIVDCGEISNSYFVDYKITGLTEEITGLTEKQFKFLENNLDEKLEYSHENNYLKIRMDFTKELYPFHTEESKFKKEDYKTREEYEMNLFLSSFLEDLSI